MDLAVKLTEIAETYLHQILDEYHRTAMQKDFNDAVSEMYPRYEGEMILVGITTENSLATNIPPELMGYIQENYPADML